MHTEIRIHGVSGTPADLMIGGPVRPDGRFDSEPSTVLRPENGDDSLLAYQWGSRTSGSASSALWLLLVPYMFLNLAGWALPPAPDRRHRLAVAAVRIAGLLLTLVFALVVATGVIGVGAYQVLRRSMSWDVALTAGVVVAALVMATLWFSTTRAEEARNDRPYLRAPHIAVALWGVWATAVSAAAEVAGTANPIGTMWVLPAALALLTAAASLWPGLESLTRLFGRVAIGASVLLLASVLVQSLATVGDLPVTLATVGGPLRGAVLAYAAAGTVATALAWSRDHRDSGPAVGSLLALAGSTGAAVGAGAVVAAGMISGVPPTPAVGILAEAFTVGALCVAIFGAFHVWTHLEPAETPRERLVRTLGSVRDDARPLLLAIPVITAAIAAVAFARFDGALPWLAMGVGPVALTTLAGVGFRMGYRAFPIATILVGGVVVGLVVNDVVSFRDTAVGFTLVLPALGVAARILGAFRSGERRRALAIPWDIGSFFSRRFHPFAPPTYRDAVERDLRMVLAQLRRTGEVVVSAHSQGSIVAVAALDAMPGTDVRLLTHGSPLATLFMRFFPISFPPETPQRIAVRPWINLWRPTDPIGGPIRGADDRRVEDLHLRVHSGYWLDDEAEYAQAVKDLFGAESNT